MAKKKRIIWSVDAFSEAEIQVPAVKLLNVLSEFLSIEVTPVYILSPAAVKLNPYFHPDWKAFYKGAASTALTKLIEDSGLKNVKDPTILHSDAALKQKSITKLTTFAEKLNAAAIVTSSHARKGASRFFLGSFAETLLLKAKIPILVVNPSMQVPEKINNILFPTDFNTKLRKGFEKSLSLTKEFDAQMTIFYKQETPLIVSNPDFPNFEIYLEAQEKFFKDSKILWLKWAQARNVQAKVARDETISFGDAGYYIVEYAKKVKTDMICMTTASSQVSSALLGSTARYVVRHAHCPVWVQNMKA